MAKTVKEYLACEERANTERMQWVPQWQLVAEYVNQRRADFQTSKQPGAFINSHLWTDDPVHMAETCASALLGYVWSAGSKSFRLKGNQALFKGGKDKEMETFWAEATEILQAEMDDIEAALDIALEESMLDLITLGTDAVFVEERNTEKPELGCLAFQPWSVQQFAAKENVTGRADTFYRRREYTVRQLVEKFTYEAVSAKVRKLYDEGKHDEKVVVLHIIEPREAKHRKEGSLAAKDMPIASVHIEVETKKIIRNSGYQELPVACARLAKRIGETYGRGRAMNALPSIMLLNQVWEDYCLALEKNLDPPMYQLNDAVAGNGYIDTSAGAVTILKIDKAIQGVPPTGKLFDIQNIQNTPEIIEKLQETISKHFMIDRLIDLNNDVEMTKGEAFLRNSIRQSTLRSIVKRMILEKFEIIVNSSFMICLRRNKFGYMPNDPAARALEAQGIEVKYLPEKFILAMRSNADLYSIEYLTPAARDLMAEEGQGMVEMLAISGEMAAFDDTIKHRVDADWTLRRLTEIKGADRRMWRDEKQVQKIVQEQREMQVQAQNAMIAREQAAVAKDAAIAQNKMGAPPGAR